MARLATTGMAQTRKGPQLGWFEVCRSSDSPECVEVELRLDGVSDGSLGSRWAPRFILERLYDRGKVSRDEEQGLGGFAGDDGRWVPSASPRLALGRHRRGGAQVLAGG